jgi:peptidyl-dipeptidase Dcp
MKNYARMATIVLFCAACATSPKTDNPLLSEFNTPHHTPPFNQIKMEHYEPAFTKAIELAKKDVDAVINSKEEPTFENTIVALDNCGETLERISGIFFNLNEACTNPEMQAIAQKVSPMLSEYGNYVNLNEELFEKIKKVYQKKDKLNLNTEQSTLLEDTYKGFVRGGANLKGEAKKRYKEISKELSMASLKFGENELKETNAFELVITDQNELKGLPESALEMAAYAAKEKGKKGWLFTLQYPSFGPIMKYADNRKLREKIYRAYSSKAFKKNDNNNCEIIKKITSLRLERANLLGYKSHADYVLEERMAKSAANVNKFLADLLEASHSYAIKEKKEIVDYAKKLGFKGTMQRWDFGYYAEKLKQAKYKIDDEMIKPYFKLENVKKGIFDLANKLYGISFKEVNNIEKYHKDVETYEVYDNDGSFLAVLYMDFFPRESKSSGAWMTEFRGQKIKNGKDIRPLINVVTNFNKPTDKKPSLLTHGQVTTFLHEFGHALHGTLSKCTYGSTSGTSVFRDFVELPSQIMENWAMEKEWLDTWAVHYKTGEKMPAELIQKIKNAENYLSAYGNDRQVSFAMTDMAWHSITEPIKISVIDFEHKALAPTEMFPAVKGSCFSTAFGHIFAGGYAAGYYGYKWAEVLDADAFSVFKQNGIFDKKTAESFRKNILEKGGSQHPMELYVNFRGHEPTNEALIKRMGLAK